MKKLIILLIFGGSFFSCQQKPKVDEKLALFYHLRKENKEIVESIEYYREKGRHRSKDLNRAKAICQAGDTLNGYLGRRDFNDSFSSLSITTSII